MSETWLVEIPLRAGPLVEKLRRVARSAGVEDAGYQVHCGLREVFGELGPQPFRVFAGGRGERRRVLGVVRSDPARFVRAGLASRSPWRAILDVEGASFVPPPRFERGSRARFELLACPVVRGARAASREGAELDAFEARGGEASGLSRADVYRDWLAGKLAGAARVERLELAEFRVARLERFNRVGGKRRHVVLVRPRALLRGTLEVEDPEAFAELLARGVGRHRAFGLGMLLARPARASPGRRACTSISTRRGSARASCARRSSSARRCSRASSPGRSGSGSRGARGTGSGAARPGPTLRRCARPGFDVAGRRSRTTTVRGTTS